MTGFSIPHDAVAIGVGAFFGAMSRYQVGRWAADYLAKKKDAEKWRHLQGWHTAGINIIGSFLLGSVTSAPLACATTTTTTKKAAWTPSPSSSSPIGMMGLTPRSKLLWGVGFCGSFTTFSTYSVDIVTWLHTGHTSKAVAYVVVNNVGGVAAAATGFMLGKKIWGRGGF
eukprot:scaffold3823_cov195-Amphora_coffeaeformis.AAC.2